jgi:hypothetical protein
VRATVNTASASQRRSGVSLDGLLDGRVRPGEVRRERVAIMV